MPKQADPVLVGEQGVALVYRSLASIITIRMAKLAAQP
jgi:hypothetical protein